jgi:hypothetical protein
MTWFYSVLNAIVGYKKPGKVKQFRVELIDMSNVRLTWVLPPVTPRQKPILHTEISVRNDAVLPWTVQDVVDPASIQELLFVDVAPGDKFYRAVVVDTDNVRGAEVETSTSLPFDAPGVVTAFAAAIE